MYEDTIRAYFTTGYVLVQYFLVRIGKNMVFPMQSVRLTVSRF